MRSFLPRQSTRHSAEQGEQVSEQDTVTSCVCFRPSQKAKESSEQTPESTEPTESLNKQHLDKVKPPKTNNHNQNTFLKNVKQVDFLDTYPLLILKTYMCVCIHLSLSPSLCIYIYIWGQVYVLHPCTVIVACCYYLSVVIHFMFSNPVKRGSVLTRPFLSLSF